MIGTQAERNLIGAVILDYESYYTAEGEVRGADFSDPRLEALWGAMAERITRGEILDQIGVANLIREKAIRVDESFPFVVADSSVYPYAIREYAVAVRAAAVKRSTTSAVQLGESMLKDGVDATLVASKLEGMLHEITEGGGTGSLRPRSLGAILSEEDNFDWVIEGLLERHDRLVVTAPEGGGKSTLMRQLAIMSAAGIHPTRFTPMEPLTALVIDAENTERQWRRASSWMAARAQMSGRDPSDHVHIVAGHRLDITSGSHLGEIHRLIDRYKPDLVYMGPLYKLVPRAIMTDDDAAPLITALDSIRERDLALIMEAHAGHAQQAGGGRDLRPRGSSALLGWPEFGFGLRPVEDDPELSTVVRWRGDREAREWPTHFRRGTKWPWEPSYGGH